MPAAVDQVLKPDKILKELAELWTTMAKPEDGQASADGGVLRACAMTLIAIVDEADDGMAIGETLALLMRDHPSRAIVIRLTDNEGVLEGRVFAQCWMPFGHRRQICCEQVEITVSMGRLEDIPGIVAPLAVPDLPRMVWLRTSKLPDTSLAGQILALGDRIIVDSNRTDSDGKGSPELNDLRVILDRGHLIGDLAWTRITEVRELLAQLLERKDPKSLQQPIVEYCGSKPSTEALYLAGWLETVFPDKRVALKKIEGPDGIRAVKIPPDIQMKLGGDCANFQMGGLQERASFRTGSDYELLNEELGITVPDRVFELVLRHLT